jgi:hypothetical protein
VLDKHPKERIPLGCLQVAAGIAEGINIEHEEVDEERWGKG